ncbi:MAG: hypothetical protein IT450_09830 [Phycisphaerales bacterium]|nr:hypothetical protein [Phycisphaerales bacterium]
MAWKRMLVGVVVLAYGATAMAQVDAPIVSGGGGVLDDGTIVVLGDFAIGMIGGAPEVALGAVPCWISAACPGDIDGSGEIGLADLSVLLSNYGTPSGAGAEQGDLDGDGDVDLQDLAGMLGVFGTSCS